MKLVVFSDPHMTCDRQIHGRSPADWLTRAVRHAARHHADAAACVILGDLTDGGGRDEYLALKEGLAGLPLDCRPMLGNHDDRGNFLDVFREVAPDANGFVQSAFDAGAFRCILLDTLSPGEGAGSLDGRRLEWLAATLSASAGPCLVFLHHPPILTGTAAFDGIGLKERSALAAVIAAHRDRIAGLFFGHCHMAVAGTVAGVPAFGIRSLVCQSLPNFEDHRFLNAPALPPAYGLILARDGELTVHSIEFGYDGPIDISPE
jgi:3',5'-cyclic AMP phosphodiesterase CpdA